MHPYKNTFFKSYGSDKFQAIPAKTCQGPVEYITALELDTEISHLFSQCYFTNHFFLKPVAAVCKIYSYK